MERMRIEHDPHHKASSHKLDKASSMKKECAATRKSLPKYLHGHLFKLQKIRVERHLKTCMVCSSEYQSLKKKSETRRILKDITPPEGLVQHLKEGASALAKLKKLLYRPLLLAAIIGIAVLVSINLASRRRDVEIENLEKSLPPAAAPMAAVASAPTVTQAAIPPAPIPAAAPPSVHRPVSEAPAVEQPIVITITPQNEQAARPLINEAMNGHNSFRKLQFSDTMREISGSLTGKEMLTFFNRIEAAGKVTYSRKKSEFIQTAHPIPFIVKLKPAPKIAAPPATQATPKVYKPAETAVQPASAPTQTALP
jgi:anti-sigma factor RsiW